MKDYYVLLTGAYNNVGDFLIVHRAKRLLEKYRPDREIVEVSRKTPFNSYLLEQVNHAKAILITGGPALRSKIWPNIVKLSNDLSKIESPIVMYGVGWKNKNNSWQSALRYSFSDQTKELLFRIDESGYKSSLRDYTSLAICEWNGLKNFNITGCPGMFNEAGTPKAIVVPDKVNSILLSPGVSYLKDNDKYLELLYLADEIKKYFPEAKIKAVFHHSIDKDLLAKEYGSNSPHVKFYRKTVCLMEGLENRGIDCVDVSNDLELFSSVYQHADAHVGYRVHGHIYTISSGKPSVLLSEDNRGMGFKEIISGSVIDASKPVESNSLLDSMRIRRSKNKESIVLQKAAAFMLYTELTGRSVQSGVSLDAIRLCEPYMKRFLFQLP